MAISEAGSSSDAALASRGEYDVFLNFRGEDTRYGFTDFLYHSLNDAGVHVYRDEEELPVGEVISEKLKQAIENTIIYIPIFSRTYASSKWCLRELALMVDNVSKLEGRKSILPIFFHVEPDDVKLKKTLYEADFKKHEEDFRDEVEAWKGALRKVDERKGWVVKKDQSQAKIVKLVVGKVLEKLKIKQKLVTEHFIGFDDRVKDLIELLDVNQLDMRVLGIYGMGGIGKTTIAKVVFNQLCSQFGKCCSFLEGIRERSTKEGLVRLQNKLLSDIVSSESVGKVEDSEEGMKRIEEILSNKKVLVVLDDVDKKDYIKKLIGNSKLYPGSRIIITTRDTTILQVERFEFKIQRYEMLKMDDVLALRLFCRHAFGRDFPFDDYHELSSKIVSLTGGLPLTIEVLGSLLKETNEEEFWEETLVRLREAPEEAILEKLRISYDNLDKYQQQIFLDIACFFFNEKKTDAMYMWVDCLFYPKRGIEVLTTRCMIKILEDETFWMHDQLIDLGRQIVIQESPNDLRKRSRLWIAKEALEVIRTKERKDKVEALNMDGPDYPMVITNEEFEGLQNLRFLNLRNGTFDGDFAKYRSKLRVIYWRSPLWDFRVDNMHLDHLVVFKLDASGFTDDSKAWNLIKRAHNLKVLSLTSCDGITTIPDFSRCLGLERLTLTACYELKRIERFIGDLQSLIELKIRSCPKLTNLPEEVGALVKLKHFSLSCCGLRQLPCSFGNLTSLIELDLSDTTIYKLPNSIGGLVKLESFLLRNTWIRKLPNSIGNLKSLRILHLSKSIHSFFGHHVSQFPSDISMLENLEELDLSQCFELKGEIPNGIGALSSLRILNLEDTHICRIPRTINMLCHLQTLNLSNCHEIRGLPELPTSLTYLHLVSKSLLSIPNLANLTNLVDLRLSDSFQGTRKSNLLTGLNLSWIGGLSSLQTLHLELLDVPTPPELANLSHLEELHLCGLNLEISVQLPSSLLRLHLNCFSIWHEQFLRSSFRLRNLWTLELDNVGVEEIPLDGLPQLEELHVLYCQLLRQFFIPLELRKLREVQVSYCLELVEIRVVGLLKSLKSFFVVGCESLRRISGLSYLKNLEVLKIKRCNVLPNVEGINELESLRSLEVTECMLLRRLIDASCTNISDDCFVYIKKCGDFINSTRIYPYRISLKYYKEEINKMEHPFTIAFNLRIEKSSCSHAETRREKKDLTPNSVTYEGFIADLKSFGFLSNGMWYYSPCKRRNWRTEIKSDEQVKDMVQLASKKGLVEIEVEAQVDSEWEGEYNDAMITIIRRAPTRIDLYTHKDGAESDISSPDEDSESATVGESKTDGTFSIDDFHSELGNAECFEGMGNGRQIRDRKIGNYGSVDGGTTTSMENRNNDKDEIGESADQNDVVTFYGQKHFTISVGGAGTLLQERARR